MQITGARGILLVGGREAARLGPWKATTNGDGWTVEAEVASVDAFWALHAGALALRLFAGGKFWTWRTVKASELAVGGQLTLRGLSDPEVTRYGKI